MRLVALTLFIALLVPLSGCLTTAGPGGAGQSAEPEVVFQPEAGLTARERLRKAIGLLEVGEAAHAKAELQAYLVEEPNSKLAKKLLVQIDADPQSFFQKAHGSESFLYAMKAGDSLSTVAKRFLGDAMQFHVLSRYNGIKSPRELKAGKVIRIPGKPPADLEQTAATSTNGSTDEATQAAVGEQATDQPAEQAELPTSDETSQEADGAVAADEAAAAEEQPLEEAAPAEPEVAAPTESESEVDTIQSLILEAQELSAQGDFKKAAVHLEQGLKQFPDSDLIKGFAAANYLSFAEQLAAEDKLELANVALERSAQLDPSNTEIKGRLATNYLALAQQHLDGGRSGEALEALQKAQELDPSNAEIGSLVANVERRNKADEIYIKGEELRDSGENIPAYDAFNEVLKIEPGHVGAEKERSLLVPVVSEHHYGEGVKALSGQDLDKALGFFNKALEINPNHTPSQLKRDQTLDLKKKLEAIQ